jgi:predicted nucleic acid-binding Zn ribbon protein
MSLMTCPSCGKQISPNAAACPECGEPVKHQPRCHSLGILFNLLAALWFVGSITGIVILYVKDKIPDSRNAVLWIIVICVTFLLAAIGRFFNKPVKN